MTIRDKINISASVIASLILFSLFGCERLQGASFVLSSPEVKDGGTLPIEFTGFGASATLPLGWSNVPEGTKSFTLIMHHIDPEGKTKWYWQLYNIPAEFQSIPKNVKSVGTMGNNSVNGRAEYAPPHSKGGGLKTYIYTIYALSGLLEIKVPAEKVSRDVLLDAMKNKILSSAEFRVTCERPEGADKEEDSKQGGNRPPPPPRDRKNNPETGNSVFAVSDPEEFEKIIGPDAKLETLRNDFFFTEGPVWIKKEKKLLFSDVDAEKIYQWRKEDGISVFREKDGGVNGNCLDKEGRLISCGQSSRQLIRAEESGLVRVLTDKYEGKKLNSPNDVTVSSDGSIWFTDPDYGLKGKKGELAGKYVFKLDSTGKLTVVIKDISTPNGICFSPDEKYLYVANSDRNEHNIIKYSIKNGMLSEKEIFCVIDNKEPDGIRCDKEGRLYVAAGDGVHIFSTTGKLIGKILTPSWPTNLCFGGEDRKTLFITARQSVYLISLKVNGGL